MRDSSILESPFFPGSFSVISFSFEEGFGLKPIQELRTQIIKEMEDHQSTAARLEGAANYAWYNLAHEEEN